MHLGSSTYKERLKELRLFNPEKTKGEFDNSFQISDGQLERG